MDDYLPSSLPAMSVVEVVVLTGSDDDEIGAEVAAAPCVSLTGDDAQRVSALWRLLPTGYQARCHDPRFGLRFLEGGVVLCQASVCQASVCWECNNIYGEANGEGFAYAFDAQASVSQDLLNECRLATGESEAPVHPYLERFNERHGIMQSPYGMEKLTTIWRERYGIPDGQLPPLRVDLVEEILRKEFPNG
jgi:hypothetical protein